MALTFTQVIYLLTCVRPRLVLGPLVDFLLNRQEVPLGTSSLTSIRPKRVCTMRFAWRCNSLKKARAPLDREIPCLLVASGSILRLSLHE